MTYVTANIHGNYSKFTELLRVIKFKESDVLYVLGDIVDYGEESMELICDMSMRYNVYTVAGEHDFLAVKMLNGFEKMLKSGKNPTKSYIAEMNDWMENGGKPTLDGYRTLDADMKEGVIDYLSDMPLYEETRVKGKDYVLVHANVGSVAEGNEEPEPEEMFADGFDFGKKYFENKTVIIGHIPTDEIPGGERGNIYHGDGVIAMDCGLERGGRLGCIRLEDGKEFYV